MKISYLTIEDITSGLFKTQILDIIDEILYLDNTVSFKIYILNRPWLYIKHRQILKEYRANYSSNNLIFCYIPLLPPLRNSLKYYFFSKIVTKWLSLIFKVCIYKNNSDLIHARSYWPTFSVLKIRKPIIFDLRSLWVLENISTGEIIENSNSHHFLKQIELDCINMSYVSTCVSSAMVDYVKNISPFAKTAMIPISVNEKYFTFNKENRVKNRKILGWDQKIIFVYSGSMGQSGINLNAIAELFKTLIETSKEYRILIVTSEENKYIKNLMYETGIEDFKYNIIHPKLNEISSWLDSADIGLHALPQQLDSSTRLGTKVVEYWINGLPVIINKNVGAAADYINNYKIGYVMEENNKTIDLQEKITEILNIDRTFISNIAVKIFSAKVISLKYLKLYKDSLNQK